MNSTLVGPKAPEALKVTLLAGDSGIDMTTVTAVSLDVVRPDGATATWTTVLSGATTLQVIATHVFDAGGLEASLPGSYLIKPQITAAGQARRGFPFKVALTPYPTP